MMKPQLYLASQSPRRAQLLNQIGVTYRVLVNDIDESCRPNEDPLIYVTRLAVRKAETAWLLPEREENIPVLGADTTVSIDNHILGKPENETQSHEMLTKLSGRTHQVYTAVALLRHDTVHTVVSISDVTFTTITPVMQQAYWESQEGHDKAGGYALQGIGALFIEKIHGSCSGIMGLPLFECHQLFKLFNIETRLGA